MDINKKIMGLYNDPLYQELNEYYSKTTIFNILGIERSENRHSSFLRWLLDNRSSHGLGDEPMKKFLRLYASKMEDGKEEEFRVMLLSGNYTINMEKLVTEQTFAKGRMDIYGEMVLRGSDGDSDEGKKVIFVIENKIYSGERDNQTPVYHEEILKRKGKGMAVEVFLTPEIASKKEDCPQCKEFKHVFYPELLNSVILPISKMTMPAESLQIITDYIRVLGKPSISDDSKKEYSIIATSDDEKNKLIEIHKKHRELFRQVLFAGNDLYSNEIEKDHLPLLHALWDSNVDLFKAILNCLNDDEINELGVNKEKIIKESNRDNSRYNIKRNGFLIGENLVKCRAALAIFKEYAKEKHATLEELDEAFPCKEIHHFYGKYYQHLFYDYAIEKDYKLYKKGLGRTFDAHYKDRYGRRGGVDEWDFFTKSDDIICLDNGMEVMVVKKWKKADFEKLVSRAKKVMGNIEIVQTE